MPRTKLAIFVPILLFAIFALVIPAAGQTVSGSLAGTVTDSNGGVLPGAEEEIRMPLVNSSTTLP